MLKEYRSRWFLIAGQKEGRYLLTLALDRMVVFEESTREKFIEHDGIDFDVYFNDLLGVSKNEKDIPRKVLLWIDKAHAPYVLTKPLHHSQTVIKEVPDGVKFRIDVLLNFELEREILGFGEFMKVLSPRLLVGRINKRLEKAGRNYVAGA